MARNKGDDGRQDTKGRAEEKEPEEEAVEEGEEAPERAKASGGNAMAAESAGASGGGGLGRSEEQGYQKGTPDEDDGDGGGPAGQAAPDDEYDTVLFGDADWLPPPGVVPNLPRVVTGDGDGGADWRIRRARLHRMKELAADAGAIEPAGVRIAPAVAREAPLAWAAAASRWLDAGAEGSVLAWWAESGAGAVGGTRLQRSARALAIGALSLRAIPAPRLPTDAALAIALGLDALSGRPDRIEQQSAGARQGLASADELVAERLATEEDPAVEPELEATPDAATLAVWERIIALRAATRWGDPGPPPARMTGDAAQHRRRQLSELGIALFRELVRERVRAAAMAGVVADLAEPELGARVHGGLRSLCREIDRHTLSALEVLRTLGRGVSRPPYGADDAMRSLLADVVTRADTVREGMIWEAACWTELLAGGPLPTPPARVSGVLRALRAGRPDRIRGEVAGPVSALVPPLDADALLAAWEAARGEGKAELAGVINVVAGAVLVEKGRHEDASWLAEAGIALGFETSCLPLITDATLRAADALVALERAVDAEETLIDLGSVLVASGADALAELLAGWAAPAG